ncbi:endolytic transglycosylase MltG [Aureicoccus marinus]|uniref:Endolytic murein transglycosylase n=1 Tax=Aureicoccus marinus TaxID=754435 RepID=A0A2S7T4J5_9FLAO|nr:endolytic transglycosylase MltG [Aureicoccus marinus]PQJ14849.1 aminodeoxychorismate lyase [Aureicoccus marinus]
MNLKRVVWAVALLGLVICGFISYQIYQAVFAVNTNFENERRAIYLPTGANLADLEQQLSPNIKNWNYFLAVAQRKGYVSRIKPGKYVLLAGMNNNEIVNTLRSQNTAVRVTFNNQETLGSLAGRISAQIEADSLSLLEEFTSGEWVDDLGLDEDTALSAFLPNSYEFFWNTSAEEFCKRMIKEHKTYWTEERIELAKKQGLTPVQAYTLASIVQKETAKASERPRVAGVYLNRLKKGIKLQADPTVIYAVKQYSGNYDTIIKRVLNRDLAVDNPYNTYKYKGLPPGPIAMPDLSALNAVLEPEEHDYYYFVADMERPGFHMFAKTLAQHSRNAQQYYKWINAQGIRR